MLLTLFIYLSFAAFIGLSLYKFRQLGKSPMHGRLELYPVPKEPGEKGHYGGSYYEELEWWHQTRRVSHSGEMKEMLKEMLLIKNLYSNQKKHWLLSYPMHMGFYLMGLWTLQVIFGGFVVMTGVDLSSAAAASSTPLKMAVFYATLITGAAGLLLVTFGSLSLFIRRMLNRGLGKYTTPQEYFNLLFLLAVSVTGLMLFSGDTSFNYAREVFASVLSGAPVHTASPLLYVHVILLSLLLIYIPLTKMSHYVGKYYAFHKVLWENDPNQKNSRMEQRVKEAMQYKPETDAAWAAPHISGPAPQK